MIKNLIKYINRKDVCYIIVIVILSILLCSSLRSCHRERIESENNLVSLTDTIQMLKTKSGKLLESKTILEGDIKLLKITNDNLWNQLEDMKATKSQQVVYIESKVENPKVDTVLITQEKNDTISSAFNFENEYRKLSGNVLVYNKEIRLGIDQDITYFDYTLAIKDNKVYLTSNNPYVKTTEIQGVTIPQTSYKKKKFHLGPSITVGYDPFRKQSTFNVGISLTYSLYSF